MKLFALIDRRLSDRLPFGQGDLYISRDRAERDLAEVLRDAPELQEHLEVVSIDELAKPAAPTPK